MLPNAHRSALEKVCGRLAGSGVPWAVSGSVALALQGVPVSCDDLDLVTSARAADQVMRLLGGIVLEEVSFRHRGHIRSELGRTELDAVEIEVLGDVQNLLPDGTWTVPPRLDMHVAHVSLGDCLCPVAELSFLQEAYAAMARFDKVRLIESARSARGQANSE